MTEEQTTLLLLKGAISDLGPDEQQKVKECAARLRSIQEEYGELGFLAFGLVGAELAAEA